MPQTTPREAARIARIVATITGPIAPAVMLGWATGVWAPDRPHLAVMAFMFGLCTSLSAAIVWSAAVCHLALAQAFCVGVEVGRASTPKAPSVPRSADLRVVE